MCVCWAGSGGRRQNPRCGSQKSLRNTQLHPSFGNYCGSWNTSFLGVQEHLCLCNGPSWPVASLLPFPMGTVSSKASAGQGHADCHMLHVALGATARIPRILSEWLFWGQLYKAHSLSGPQCMYVTCKYTHSGNVCYKVLLICTQGGLETLGPEGCHHPESPTPVVTEGAPDPAGRVGCCPCE